MLVPFIRTLVLYIAIIFAVRLMGKRQVGEMQPTELVITILVSAVASVPIQDIDIPLSHGLVPILTLVSAEVLMSALSMKYAGFRRLLNGHPIIVLRSGEIDRQALRSLRLTVEDLCAELRLAGVNDLRQVVQAQVETNGRLSLLLDTAASPVTPTQVGLHVPAEQPFYPIIADGVVSDRDLAELGRDRGWLNDVLRAYGVEREQEVFLLSVDRSGSAIFIKKEASSCAEE